MQILILAGGSGTRFWPLSRRKRPKQLLAVEGERTLLQATADRVAPIAGPESIWVCTTAALAEEVRRQLPDVPEEQILLEPEGRNTAPAIAWSVHSMPEELRDRPVVILPADHRVEDGDAFLEALQRAERSVEANDRVMTLGVQPTHAETGYGYLELGEEVDPANGVLRVARFVEKPVLEEAERYFDSGNYLWNAGIFLFRGETFLRHVERLQPEIAALLTQIGEDPGRLAELYPQMPKTSIDYGIMEHLPEIATVPLDCGWSDLGSWSALAEILPPNEAGNRTVGEVVAIDATDNLLYSDAGTIAVVGVSGLVVVRTEDSVLVLPKERAQDVKAIVEHLREGRTDLL